MTDQEDFNSIYPQRVRKVNLHKKSKGKVESYQPSWIVESFDCLKQEQYAATYLEFLKDSPLLQPEGSRGPSELFQDKQFRAGKESLMGGWANRQKLDGVTWHRMRYMFQDSSLFGSRISPVQMHEGSFGNCAFLAAVATLAEQPHRILNLFKSQQLNKQGRYAVKFLEKGRWSVIPVDDFLPFLGNNPLGGHTTTNDFWLPLLEKAYAKGYSCYMNTSYGHYSNVLHDLTGAPVNFLNLKEKSLNYKETLWRYIIDANKKNYAVCASSRDGTQRRGNDTGSVIGYAQTVLGGIQLNFKGQNIRLVRMRSPWGQEPEHQWSRYDPRWAQVSPQDKKRLLQGISQPNGIFFIPLDNFTSKYISICSAEINDNASYIYETAKDPTTEGICFKLQIHEDSIYSLQIDNTAQNSLSFKDAHKFSYPTIQCKVFSEGKNKVEEFSGEERLVYRKLRLRRGVYYVFVLIHFDVELEKNYDVTLGVYSLGTFSLQLATNKQRDVFGDVLAEGIGEMVTVRGKSFKGQRSQTQGELKGGRGRSISIGKGRPTIKFNYKSNPTTPPPTVNVQINRRIGGMFPYRPPYQPRPQPALLPEEQSLSPSEVVKDIIKIPNIEEHIKQHKPQINKADELDLINNIEKQLVFIEASPAENKLKELKKTKTDFLDERFPPNLTSLTGEWGHIKEWKQVTWERISKALPRSEIFGEISPNSIKQGFLGDCYFLAGLAALAQRPQRIANLFLLHQRNDINYYSVRLLYRGKWLTVDMDDYLPFLYNQPAFSNSAKGSLWVPLLQKAWAKVYSSYKRIQAGFPEETLHDLTGAPIKHIYMRKSNFDPDKQWKYLVKASLLDYSMVASSQAGSDQLKSVSGIVQGHAYTLMEAYQLQFQGQTHRLVKLRNPWGKGQGSSTWSDKDPNWSKISQSQKQRIGYNNFEDGIFFFSYQKFCKQFKIITIAEINDHASYIYLSSKDSQKKGCYFTITIHNKGNYSFQIDNSPERTFQSHYNTDYRYPHTAFEMGMLCDKGYVRKMVSMLVNARTLFHKAELEPGKYVCFGKTDFDEEFQKDFSLNLAVYGDCPCEIKLSTHKQAVIFRNDPKVEWPRSGDDKTEYNSLRSYHSNPLKTSKR